MSKYDDDDHHHDNHDDDHADDDYAKCGSLEKLAGTSIAVLLKHQLQCPSMMVMMMIMITEFMMTIKSIMQIYRWLVGFLKYGDDDDDDHQQYHS